MSFLKNIISDAVGDGIGKGISNAVGKAVESAVKPSADKLAGQAAENINQATAEMARSAEAVKAASDSTGATNVDIQSAMQNVNAGVSTGEGTANLENALAGWANQMNNFAAQAAQNFKECPECGEVVPMDRKFCPSCGAKLPEESMGAGYVCPKCGKQNVPGERFCAECGTVLPAAEKEVAEEAAAKAAEAEEAARIAEEEAAAKAAEAEAAAKSAASGAASKLGEASETVDAVKGLLKKFF